MPRFNQIAHFCRRTGVEEITARVMRERGYSWDDIELIHGDNTARRQTGEAIEATIRARVAVTGRLPCGEPVRIDPARNERETWLAFQFETGTKGDQYLRVGATSEDTP